MRTQICVTIDTEFSIAQTFADPDRRRPLGEENVTCPVGGEEQGLGFLLDLFAAHRIPATFFVETLQSAYFGDAPMGRIVERLLKAGQDVQLHLHPCWLAFEDADWRAALRPGAPPDDDCGAIGASELCDIIGRGARALERIGARTPVTLRTGNLRASRDVYRAMAGCSIPVASNIGIALSRPADPGLHHAGGRHRIEGVLEVPVLSYAQLPVGAHRCDRLLTITGSSTAETEAILWRAHREDVPTVVLLTHPFEFIKGDRHAPARQAANRINQQRLRRLCAFIAANAHAFEATSFGDAAPAWLDAPDVPAPALRAPLLPVTARMAINKANDLFMAL